MNIKVYNREKQDGLAEVISSQASITFASLVTPHTPLDSEVEAANEDISDSLKGLLTKQSEASDSNEGQFDLYYMNSVLVSTGWNKNDDVFDSNETWRARTSPEDKQFNYMHDETDIIGHITDNMVVDFEGNRIEQKDDQVPENFNIVTSSVLYNSWSNPELKERMANIIAEIEDGKWFVSMECLFNDFDYAVVNVANSEEIVVKRDETSAFLTKHLRAYGGTGEYEGYKVGRLLKNIAFSGTGLVQNPANPKSVILTETDPFKSSEAQIIINTSIKEKFNMSSEDNMLRQQIDELKSELAAAKTKAESAREEIIQKGQEEMQAQIASFESTLAEKEVTIKELEASIAEGTEKVAELEASLKESNESLAEAKAQIEAFEAEAKVAKRRSVLTEAGVEDADEVLEQFADVSDETFDSIVALVAEKTMKKKGEFPPQKKDEDKEDDDKDEKARKEAKKDKASEATDETISEEQDEAEADTETLEEVEEVAEAALSDCAEDDSVVSARSAASAWLETNVLRSTANITE